MLPYELHGVDKLGRPIVWVPFGQWDLAGIVEKQKQEQFVRYTYQYCQNIELAIVNENRKRIDNNSTDIIWQFIGIFDMGDFSYRQLLSPSAIKLMTSLASAAEMNWPLRCGSMVAINAPGIVKTLLAILKPFFSKNTRSAIEMHNSNRKEWEEVLRNHIEACYIPVSYGGDRNPLKNIVE